MSEITQRYYGSKAITEKGLNMARLKEVLTEDQYRTIIEIVDKSRRGKRNIITVPQDALENLLEDYASLLDFKEKVENGGHDVQRAVQTEGGENVDAGNLC